MRNKFEVGGGGGGLSQEFSWGSRNTLNIEEKPDDRTGITMTGKRLTWKCLTGKRRTRKSQTGKRLIGKRLLRKRLGTLEMYSEKR